jgi:hypothetical protein
MKRCGSIECTVTVIPRISYVTGRFEIEKIFFAVDQ